MKKHVSITLAALAGIVLLVAALAAQTFNPQDVIPFDKAVRTATLPNGLKYFVRQNGRPAKRVSLRLAVKAGSLNEADDQLGLAHLIEHMAFNGSEHFKPGELVSYFESTRNSAGTAATRRAARSSRAAPRRRRRIAPCRSTRRRSSAWSPIRR